MERFTTREGKKKAMVSSAAAYKKLAQYENAEEDANSGIKRFEFEKFNPEKFKP